MTQPITNLPIGTKIKFGQHQVNTETKQDIIWKVAAKNHAGYPANSVTLVAENIMDLRGFDAKEPSNSNADRKSYGNNRYKDSNIRQWLNKAGNPWFVKTHIADEPPTDGGMNQPTGYDNRDGFLSAFSNDELGTILNTSLKVVKNTITDGGGSETVEDKVFLLSTTEVGLANENSVAEGSRLPLFTTDNSSRVNNLTQQAFSNTKSGSKPSSVGSAWYWWLRTPGAGTSRYLRGVSTDGSLSGNDAYYGNYGVRPALNLSSEILVSNDVDVDGSYTIIYNQPPIISGQDEDLGTKTNEFSYLYSVEIGDGNITNITENINGIVIGNYDNPTELNLELVVTNEIMSTLEFYKTHIIEIIVTDDNNMVTTRTLEFIKGVQTLPVDTPLLEVVDKVADIPMLMKGGKQLVGTAITGVDDSVVIPTNPTFNDLATGIGGISTGKKWASGNTASTSGTITIGNLEFKPSFVFAKVDDNQNRVVFAIEDDPVIGALPSYQMSINGSLTEPSLNKSNFSFNENGFSITNTRNSSSLTYNWIAFE